MTYCPIAYVRMNAELNPDMSELSPVPLTLTLSVSVTAHERGGNNFDNIMEQRSSMNRERKEGDENGEKSR